MSRKFIMFFLWSLLFCGVWQSVCSAKGQVVSFNTATVDQLANIEDAKIPSELAQAIVKYREENGVYKTPEALLKVPGMTNDFFEMLNPTLKDGDVVHDPDAEPALAPSKC